MILSLQSDSMSSIFTEEEANVAYVFKEEDCRESAVCAGDRNTISHDVVSIIAWPLRGLTSTPARSP